MAMACHAPPPYLACAQSAAASSGWCRAGSAVPAQSSRLISSACPECPAALSWLPCSAALIASPR